MKVWDGFIFQRSLQWQVSVGLEVFLGHNGSPCPIYVSGTTPEHPTPTSGGNAQDTQDDADYSEETQGCTIESMKRPTGVDEWGNRYVTVVDSNGVHYIRIKACRCTPSMALHRQLLQIGLYPATQVQPQTAFTTRVLNDCFLENIECKTSFSNYYSKLRRLTSKGFPHLVPVGSVVSVCAQCLHCNIGSLS